MIYRDLAGNAVGHTEVIDSTIPPARQEILTATTPSKGQTSAQAWAAALWTTALLPENF